MEVVLEGWAQAWTVGFVVEQAKQREDMAQARADAYLALVKSGKQLSLRLFQDAPKSVVGSVSDLLAAGTFPLAVVEVSHATRLRDAPKGGAWLLTAERTLLVAPQGNGGVELVRQMIEEVRNAQRSMVPPSARGSLTKRISRSLSRLGSGSASSAAAAARRKNIASIRNPLTVETNPELTSLDNILASRNYREQLRAYLRFAFAVENLEFLEAVERYEAMSLDMVEERAELFAAIVNQFVQDDSEDQVNLPSRMIRELKEQLYDIQFEGADPSTLSRDTFADAKREINVLIERNFFTSFSVSMQEKEARERQVKEMTGTFARVWQQAGLDGYRGLLGRQRADLRSVGALREFFEDFLGHLERQSASMRKLSEKYPVMQHAIPGSQHKARRLDRVLAQLYSSLTKHASILAELAADIKSSALGPILELERTMATSMENIENGHRAPVEAVEKSRRQLERSLLQEAEKAEALHTLEEQVEQRTLQRKKQTKKQTNMLATLQRELEAAAAECDACELRTIEAEDASADKMMGAFEMLESLALHRLETLRQVLTQVALAHRSSANKSERFVQAMLFDCMDMDPIAEVLDIAAVVQAGARKVRTKSLVPRAEIKTRAA